jgi:tetratricopeptide (TPR) repeat protein
VGVTLERIEITPFAVTAGELVLNRRTGYLTVLRQDFRTVLYWSQGELVLATSTVPDESLASFLLRRGTIGGEAATELMRHDPIDAVARFHETGVLNLSARQSLLRDWLLAVTIPLFSLEAGTTAFSDETAIDPDKRVFLQSTAALLLDGVRSIVNGLILRRSLGDIKRDITMARDDRFSIDSVPLTDPERRIAQSLREQQSIENFLKQFPNESTTAAKVVIGMLALGIFKILALSTARPEMASMDDMQRDLEMLAAIGANDPRSLRAIGFSRQMTTLDHYQLLNIPRAANRAQILAAGDELRKRYDPATFPPAVRDALTAIHRRIDEAVGLLKDPARRPAYDKLVSEKSSGGRDLSIDQRVNQRIIAEQNFGKARDLSVTGDYYGAIILLKQAVNFLPDFAEAWYLLGSCQERNPKWRREAAESFQKCLSIDPNHVDAMISLGDLYKTEGLATRAQSFYEDVLKIAPDNPQAKSRLAGLKKK